MNNQTGTNNPNNYQQLHCQLILKTVTVPAHSEHNGVDAKSITLKWNCPTCGGPRGEVTQVRSYDGSRILFCDGWSNPCGHVDKYSAVLVEATSNQYNDGAK
jgi:hypothetical protein